MRQILEDINKQFPTPELFIERFERMRWPTGIRCPYCNSTRHTPLRNERRYHCNYCNSSFSATTGTFLSHTPLDLRKWLAAVIIVLNHDPAAFTSRRLATTLSVNRNTACRMTREIEIARHSEPQMLASLNLITTEENIQ